MKSLRFIVLWLVFGITMGTSAAEPDIQKILKEMLLARTSKTTRLELERLAAVHGHFSRTVIIQNRELNLESYRDLFEHNKEPLPVPDEQVLLAAGLKLVSKNREALVELLKHNDPKVRTLALGALFLREDGRDLPLIAAMIPDTAPTFPDLHKPLGIHRSSSPSRMVDVETPQTVGEVAEAMGSAYLSAAELGTTERSVFGDKPGTEELARVRAAFQEYWQQRQGREHCASWYVMKLSRATRRTSPIHPEWGQDVQRVFAEIQALPPEDRAWTLLYARDRTFPDGIISDKSVLEALKAVKPEKLMAFLQHDHATGPDDPDLRFDKTDSQWPKDRSFITMAAFILSHARELLRPSDAEAVFACARQEEPRREGKVSVWFDAAVALKSREGTSKAKAFVQATLKRRDPQEINESSDPGLLVGALWKVRGDADRSWLVEWFYKTMEVSPGGEDGPHHFLREVQRARREDTQHFMKALIADPRFERTDLEVIKQMLAIAEGSSVDWSSYLQEQGAARRELPKPLVNDQEIEALRWGVGWEYREAIEKLEPGRLPQQPEVLPVWRNLLRHYYGIKEQPIIPLPKALAVIKDPSATFPYRKMPMQADHEEDDLPRQMRFSPDGKWLAILQSTQVEIREPTDGKVMGNIKSMLSWPVMLGFSSEPGILGILDRNNGMLTYDLSTMAPIKSKSFKPFDEKAHLPGVYAFNSTGDRLGRVTMTNADFYDIRSQRILWQKAVCDIKAAPYELRLAVALSPDGRLMAASTGAGRYVQLLETKNGGELRRFCDFPGGVRELTFSPDGAVLAIATMESGVRLWHTGSGRLLREINYPILPNAGSLAFSPDGKWLAAIAWPENTASAAKVRVGVFQVKTGELRWEFTEERRCDYHGNSCIAMAFSPEGDSLWTVAGNRVAKWLLR